MEKYYRFAGLPLAVTPPQGQDYADDETLSPFRVDKVSEPHRFVFQLVPALSAPDMAQLAVMPDYTVYGDPDTQIRYVGAVQGQWQSATMRCVHSGKAHHVELKQEIFSRGMTAKTFLNACATEHLVARAGGFVFHSAYIEHDAGAILFTAPSGTGKSTQADLWQQLRGAKIINGDRSVVRVDGEKVLAEGIPFSGSSRICVNRSLPLKAIVYLSQAPQTSICRLRGAQAFARVWEGISLNVWDKEDVSLVSEALQQVLQTVPVFHLACTPDESAVAALEEQLGK